MNGDLQMRLSPFYRLSKQEEAFFYDLIQQLGKEALLGLDAGGESVQFKFEYIELNDDDSAYVVGNGDDFCVHIDKRMPTGMMLDFVLHELAHVHSWERADDVEDHCEEFGKSYALLYRLYLDIYETYWGKR
jgi:hypothetical protein